MILLYIHLFICFFTKHGGGYFTVSYHSYPSSYHDAPSPSSPSSPSSDYSYDPASYPSSYRPCPSCKKVTTDEADSSDVDVDVDVDKEDEDNKDGVPNLDFFTSTNNEDKDNDANTDFFNQQGNRPNFNRNKNKNNNKNKNTVEEEPFNFFPYDNGKEEDIIAVKGTTKIGSGGG